MLTKILKIFAPALALIAGLTALYPVALMMGVETVSFRFLIGFPLVAGIVIMHFRPKGSLIGLGKSMLWMFAILSVSLAGVLIAGLEGLICIVMAIGPIFLGALLGGIIYLIYQRWLDARETALKIVTLPIFVMLFMSLPAPQPVTYEISNAIIINAPPAIVFAMIKSIPDIAPAEIPTRLSHLIGVPKPTAAVWEERPDGAVRHSHWGDDVHFRERITALEENRLIAWDFEFPEGWIADGIEDPHVKVGGQYFNVLSGTYRLEDLSGRTRLTLTTRTYDASNLGLYAEFWHHYFFEGFHEVILELVKARIEA